MNNIQSSKSQSSSRYKPTKASRSRKVKRTICLRDTARDGVSTGTSLSSMPFDILFEILALLSSRDLIALAYTNKGFRQYLASPAATTMWKTARESTVGMPACAPYLSEFHWADLLWGKKCQGAAVVSFALLRRCCALCKKTHLVDLKMFMELFPDVDTSIFALVPHMMGPGSIGMTEYYWDDDIRDMSRRLVALEAKTSLGTARLSDAVKTFMGEQRLRVTAIMNHAAMCESVFAVRKSKKEVLERLRALIVTCGHNYLDACRAVSLEHYIVQSTSQSILTTRSYLLQKADDAKQYRLNQARLEIIKTRHLLVRKLYSEYCEPFTQLQLTYMPRVEDVFVFGAFAALIRQDVIDIEEAHFVNAMARLPELIARWTNNRAQKLSGLVTRSFAAHSNPVELATSIFTCPRCTIHPSARSEIILIDHDKSLFHANRCFRMSFCDRGHVAATSLVSLLGLDVRTATPPDLDDIDARFFCLLCKPVKMRKNMVAHFANPRLKKSHVTPSWRRLNEGEYHAVKAREGPDPTLASRIWSCNHCDRFTFNTHSSVVDHVESQHAVDEPEEVRDFFRDPRKIRPEPRRGYIVVDSDRPDYDGDARVDDKPYICL